MQPYKAAADGWHGQIPDRIGCGHSVRGCDDTIAGTVMARHNAPEPYKALRARWKLRNETRPSERRRYQPRLGPCHLAPAGDAMPAVKGLRREKARTVYP
jgi:hypothetical protein